LGSCHHLEAIGNTPLVELSRLTRSLPGRVLLKLDYLNPGVLEERRRLGIIEEAEASGALRREQTVVETDKRKHLYGACHSLRRQGYRFVAVMSRGNSAERARMMRALGAESF